MLVFTLENESEVRSALSKDPWTEGDMLTTARIESWEVLLDVYSEIAGAKEDHEFFMVRRRFGKHWNHDVSIREQKGWPEHAAFMDSLVDEGLIILGGPVDQGPNVQILACGKNIVEVIEKLARDPWILDNLIENISIQKWNIPLGKLSGTS